MPPVHPGIVHLPIAFVVLAVIADLIGWWWRIPSLRATGRWSVTAAALGGLAAVAAGYYDMNRAALSGPVHGYVHLHLTIGLILAASLVALALWRWLLARLPRPLGAAYAVAAAFVLVLTSFQGWYGGEMVYAYGASVAAAGQGTEPADQAQERLREVYRLITGGEVEDIPPHPHSEKGGNTEHHHSH